jgi:hypothetical protein
LEATKLRDKYLMYEASESNIFLTFFKIKFLIFLVDGYEKLLEYDEEGNPYLNWRNHVLKPLPKLEKVFF